MFQSVMRVSKVKKCKHSGDKNILRRVVGFAKMVQKDCVTEGMEFLLFSQKRMMT
jgi:hypothetical protein